MYIRSLVVFSLTLSCATLGGCAGSGAGLDSNGRPLGSEGSTGTLTATFQSIQDNVFTPICSVCHAGGGAPEGMRLDAVNSYAMIVGVPSREEPSILRIKPGDPDNSYLIQKIEGHAAVGAQMPFGGPPLAAATITTIRQWVTDGALQQPVAAANMAFTVAAVVPAMGDVVLESPASVVIAFNHELDRTRLDDTSLRLERISSKDGATSEAEVPAIRSVPAGDSAALLITPRERLANGLYRVVVVGQPATGVSDIAGARLGSGARDIVVTVFAVESSR
jgi:hypothetical protein